MNRIDSAVRGLKEIGFTTEQIESALEEFYSAHARASDEKSIRTWLSNKICGK
jgi:Holliday junction resolvasome RuvABC DNA-binding subunit